MKATYEDLLGVRVRAEPFDAIELHLLPLWGETRSA
jgi:hypothetical protein